MTFIEFSLCTIILSTFYYIAFDVLLINLNPHEIRSLIVSSSFRHFQRRLRDKTIKYEVISIKGCNSHRTD